MTGPYDHSLVLRLAGPLQSWGGRSQFNRRDTQTEPTKSGILGLLAAAQGLRRQDPIAHLLGLRLGVRVDQAGTLLRDYHTVSDLQGRALMSATVNAKGQQKLTAPAKYTHVTQRYYLQDAVFVAAISGPTDLLTTLAHALRNPGYPLALGRRSCPPTQPVHLPVLNPDNSQPTAEPLWPGQPLDVLKQVPWQRTPSHEAAMGRQTSRPARITLPVTVDDEHGDDTRTDVPVSFDPLTRGFVTRRVRQHWVDLPSPWPDSSTNDHDPFALLGW